MSICVSNQMLPERVERMARERETPFLVMDKAAIKQRFEQLEEAFGRGRTFYALKANPHRRIAELIRRLGAGFEVSSEGELNLLLRLGVSPGKIISSNPVKSEKFIQAAHAAGVKILAFDSHAEVQKLAKLAPGSEVYVRLSVSNEGSEWPLSGKFGVEEEKALELLTEAERRHLRPVGIAFHVGSQCTDPATWEKAIEKSKVVWKLARSQGMELQRLNIGGGFPIKYTKPVPSLAETAEVVNGAIRRVFPEGVDVLVEPGRSVVGEAGVLVTTVRGKAARNGQKWLYLDVGVFNGLLESLGGISYPLLATRNGTASEWVLAGPSCDSLDVISKDVELPELEVGDKVYIASAGAYTTAYASEFNGSRIPKTYFV